MVFSSSGILMSIFGIILTEYTRVKEKNIISIYSVNMVADRCFEVSLGCEIFCDGAVVGLGCA